MADERERFYKRFPLQGGLTISWEAAERAYAAYVKLYGSSQSLERLAERGGFGVIEFAVLYSYPRLPPPHGDLTKAMKDGALERAIQQALRESDIRLAPDQWKEWLENAIATKMAAEIATEVDQMILADMQAALDQHKRENS